MPKRYRTLESQKDRVLRTLLGRGRTWWAAAGVVGLIAITAVQLGSHVARSVPAPIAGVAIFALGLTVLYLWRSKLNVPAVVLGSAVAGAVLLSQG